MVMHECADEGGCLFFQGVTSCLQLANQSWPLVFGGAAFEDAHQPIQLSEGGNDYPTDGWLRPKKQSLSERYHRSSGIATAFTTAPSKYAYLFPTPGAHACAL